jgi:uracil-DNA glycosylase
MNDYLRVLESAEQHLAALKASGVRYLNVQSNTLNALGEPPAGSISKNEIQDVASLGRNGILSYDGRTGAAGETSLFAANGHGPPAEAGSDSVYTTPTGLLSYDSMPSAHPSVGTNVVSANGYAGAGNVTADMEELRQRAFACLKCPHLVRSRKNVVFGVGSVHAELMFVGEAPGADEDAQGEPFVGAAGQLLTRIIKTMGLSRETVYIANILKCRPDMPAQSSGNRKPTHDEMKTCLPYLLAQIELIRPKVLVALGATAIEGLLGKAEGIGKLRGKFQMFRNIPLMPTFHPAYLLRNQALTEKRKVWEDMIQVMEKLQMEINEKQRAYFLKA